MSREYIKNAHRVVIKIGTRVLTENDNTIAVSVVRSIVRQVSELNGNERKFIVVSSGAIALGLNRMGLKTRPGEINLLQAAASLGQSSLMHAYEAEFRKSKYEPAQILIAYEDIQNRKKYLNIRNTIFTLWSFNSIPIVNENDSVTYAEIRFGDNDLLAAHLSIMIDADLLLILTDIDGVYDKNPNLEPDARIIKEIPKIDDEIKKRAKGKGSHFSSGGMESKLKAAEIATKSGVGVVIANGRKVNLKELLNGKELGTFCVPSKKRMRGKRSGLHLIRTLKGKSLLTGEGKPRL